MAARASVAGFSLSAVCLTDAALGGRRGPLLSGDAFDGQRLTVRCSTATLIRESRRSGGGLYRLSEPILAGELSDRRTAGTWRPLSSRGAAVASSRSPVEQRALSRESSPAACGGVRGR